MILKSLRPVPRTLGVAAAVSVTSIGLLAPAATAAEVTPVPSNGVFQMQGSGWGHGRGMSQWGAYQAASEGHTYGEILSFYYPGTERSKLPAGKVRVLLADDTGRNLVVRAVPGLQATYTTTKQQTVTLPAQPSVCDRPATRWRARAVGTRMRLDAKCRGQWQKVATRLGSTVSFEVPGGIVSTATSTAKRGYRGAVSARYLGLRSVQVVNTVPMEDYLRPVVGAEVSASWPRAALRAQAIAARTYAAAEMNGRSSMPFDVYDSVRSQAYPGAVEYGAKWVVTRVREYGATDAAVAATAGKHVTVGGVPVLTQFSASNGGATAASPLPHMTVVADPWDAAAARNPRRSWSDSVSAATLRAWCPRAGEITSIKVLAREGAGKWGGRISSMRVVGKSGSCTYSSDSSIRSVLGVYSSFLRFTS